VPDLYSSSSGLPTHPIPFRFRTFRRLDETEFPPLSWKEGSQFAGQIKNFKSDKTHTGFPSFLKERGRGELDEMPEKNEKSCIAAAF
jgi:hypothetical protein